MRRRSCGAAPKRRPVRLEIHGDASNQPPVLREEIERRLEASRSVVAFRGTYDNRKVHALMQGCHAVLVPSIWWENSPLVIQEAFAARRPVITSDIGGMAEKVRHGVDGFHFQARSGLALADLLRDLAERPERLDALQQTLSVPPTLEQTVRATREVYEIGRPAAWAPQHGQPLGGLSADRQQEVKGVAATPVPARQRPAGV
ncbi:glycosyltransferase [Paeniroseomonas aquatica]|uniref:glycosyltransferase n=1 Tax=Paeniroseomonas aquatica TaxID=373043 RepID=UPI00360DCCE7